MTDRKLLESAAKAAGIDNLQWESDGTIQNRMNRPTIPYSNHGLVTATDWNPLRDDGDALRLAVKLNIDVYSGNDEGAATFAGYFIGTVQKFTIVQHGDDPYAATRRAIVRAAAQIGEKLK